MSKAQEAIEGAGFEIGEVRQFLHNLRDSGVVNMFGSGEYLGREFGFSRYEQKEVVLQYMDDGLGEES